MVFAPEQQAGAFGGDPDNFEYPRFCLDCTFFRAYENDQPAKTPFHFGWSKENVKDGELVFVSGHPGRTNRNYEMLHYVFQRDFLMPQMLQRLYRYETIYSIWGDRSEENMRRIKNDINGVKNSRKVRRGQLAGLLTPDLITQKALENEAFWDAVRQNESFASEIETLPNLGEVLAKWGAVYPWYSLLEQSSAFPCRTFQIARTIVRLADESEKPNEERLPEYQESNLESLKRSLFSDAPIYEDVEVLKLTEEIGRASCRERV